MSFSFRSALKKHSSVLLVLFLVLLTAGALSFAPASVNTFSDISPRVSFVRSNASISTPSLSAKAAVLIECSSGEMICQKNSDVRMPMASTTKIMTALTVIENTDLTETVTIPKEACGIEGSSVYLREGERFTVEELLYALMLASANDAATALALHVSASIDAFAELMNNTASELGLKNTHFTNPHGLDDSGHYTSAADLAKISREAMQNDVFRRICATKKTIINKSSKESARLLVNHNRLLSSYDGAVGIKTGFTKTSGRCLVSAAERDGLMLIAVTLNASDDWNDHKKLLDLGFSVYNSVTLMQKGELSLDFPLVGSLQSSVVCTNADEVRVILPRDAGEITTVTEMKRFEFAPIKRGETVGRVLFYLDGKLIAYTDIKAVYHAEKR